MIKIRAHLVSLQQAASDCRGIAENVENIRNSFVWHINQLEPRIRAMSNISGISENIRSDLEHCANILRQSHNFLNEVHDTYIEVDRLQFKPPSALF